MPGRPLTAGRAKRSNHHSERVSSKVRAAQLSAALRVAVHAHPSVMGLCRMSSVMRAMLTITVRPRCTYLVLLSSLRALQDATCKGMTEHNDESTLNELDLSSALAPSLDPVLKRKLKQPSCVQAPTLRGTASWTTPWCRRWRRPTSRPPSADGTRLPALLRYRRPVLQRSDAQSHTSHPASTGCAI